MHYHWKDREDDQHPPASLLQINASDKPGFRLQSYPDGRGKILCANKVLCWFRLDADWSGGYLVKSYQSWHVVPPIPTQDVARIAALPVSQQDATWRHYFSRHLAERAPTLLYKGLWLLEQRSFRPDCGVESVFRTSLEHIEWYAPGVCQLPRNETRPTDIIALKEWDLDAARIKWWRRKIQEHAFPPVLLWYVSCLDRYVILDGHQRLIAAILEKHDCPLLVLYPVVEIPTTPDPQLQQRIVATLQPELPVDKVNDLLLKIFDSKPQYLPITRAWAAPIAEDNWEQEVTSHLLHHGLDALMPDEDAP